MDRLSDFKAWIKKRKGLHKLMWPMLYAYRQAVMRTAQAVKGVDRNKVVFSSLHARCYNDNPRYISEKLHEMRPQTDIVWVYKKGYRDKVAAPDYVRKVPAISFRGIVEQATARVWVDNVKKSETFYLSDKQYYINTWHGDRGFKCVGGDSKMEKVVKVEHEKLEKRCAIRTAGSDFGERVYRTAFGYKGVVMKEGCPRNDILLRGDDEAARRTREGLGIPEGTGVLLYAPTYRDNKHVMQKTALDIPRTLKCFEEATGKPWVCLYRAHYLSMGLDISQNEKILDATGWPEMAELMLVSDALISDYSSCAADFMLTGRPAFLYIADYDDYTGSSRNLYFDLEQSPYPLARTMEELETLIRTTDAQKARQTAEAIGEFYGLHETGHACERVCEFIIDKLQ